MMLRALLVGLLLITVPAGQAAAAPEPHEADALDRPLPPVTAPTEDAPLEDAMLDAPAPPPPPIDLDYRSTPAPTAP